MGKLAAHGNGSSRINVPGGEVTSRRPDPQAWAIALDLANGDASRLEASEDGLTVTVHNRGRR